MIYLSFLLIAIAVVLILLKIIIITNDFDLVPKKDNLKCSILIPARNESKVIENLLISIENQTLKIKPEDVYIIVENKDDPTIQIASNHKMNIIFRKDLSKKRKGYALDDAVKEVLHKNYDAYFIFDADNILDKDFIKEMHNTIMAGYDIGVGYRNTKNSNNLVSASSALTFTMINTIGNSRKNKYCNNITISGTGYYISGRLIKKWKGFPFHTLTEDYELSLYCVLNNISTFYNDKAIFFDEQPEKLSVSITQRSRWIKGYFQARCKYLLKIIDDLLKGHYSTSKFNEYIGVRPLIYLIIGIILLTISFYLDKGLIIGSRLLILIILLCYFILVVISYLILRSERGKLTIEVSKLQLVLYNPLFLFTYIICALIALFNRNLGWKEIKHTKNIKKVV